MVKLLFRHPTPFYLIYQGRSDQLVNRKILAVDIGNTHMTIGLLQDENVLCHWRLSTHIHRTADEYLLIFKQLIQGAGFSRHEMAGTVISCVVPPVLSILQKSLTAFLNTEPFIIQPGIKLPIHIRYNKPEDVGADRVVNACAAVKMYEPPLIIVDFGTATTFCAVNAELEYLGGAIFPGISTTSEALYKSAALLPRVAFQPVSHPIGKTTIHSIQSGLFFGYLSLVEGLVSRFKTQLQSKAKVISTGGLGKLLSEHAPFIDEYEPFLTLKGLDILFRLNQIFPNDIEPVWPSSAPSSD